MNTILNYKDTSSARRKKRGFRIRNKRLRHLNYTVELMHGFKLTRLTEKENATNISLETKSDFDPAVNEICNPNSTLLVGKHRPRVFASSFGKTRCTIGKCNLRFAM